MSKVHANQPLEAAAQKYKQQTDKKQQAQTGKFKQVLQDKLKSGSLKLSKHAKQKLQSRGINFNQQELAKLNQAVDKGKEKGAKESLVMVNDNAYIVSVENETVITAMTKDSMQEDVVTNIDSAIVMK
jgi:flagellar operon protein